MTIVDKVKKDFNNSSDLIIRNIYKTYIIYLESLCDSDKINFYIMQNISQKKHITTGPNSSLINKYKDIIFYLSNGFTIVINKNIYAVETRANIIRSIEKPDTEPSLYGPKDSFNENIQTNIGLIKRRLKTNNLVNIDFTIGKETNTKISLFYLNNKANIKQVNKIVNKLKLLNDNIIAISDIKSYLGNDNKTTLPTILESQRPDNASYSLLQGKIIILCDNSPFCLILPAYFTDFINPVIEDYSKKININFLKILRFICLIFTLCAPALYICLINYNQETISTYLLFNIAIQRNKVAFPTYIECFIMLLVCFILKESDIRFPSSYGSAVSIVGALLLGEAAVSAGLFSPIMIIITAFTFITSMIFIDQEMINSLRIFRFLFLLLSVVFGLFGFFIGIILFLIHLCGIEILDNNYTYPLAPYNKKYINQVLFKGDNS